MDKTPPGDAEHTNSGDRRRYRARISRTLLDYATDQSQHCDSLTAYVLADTDGAIASQLQHAIARAGVEWPGIDATVVVSRTSDDEDKANRGWEHAWFYLCFRNNELFALLTPAPIDRNRDSQSQPMFECALLEPNIRRRRSQQGDTHYRGTSSSVAGQADWRVTLSDRGFSLRLSRVANERQAVVTTISAVAEDCPRSPKFRALLLSRMKRALRSLTNWLVGKHRGSDQHHVTAGQSLPALENRP